jgi:hypothetical protein
MWAKVWRSIRLLQVALVCLFQPIQPAHAKGPNVTVCSHCVMCQTVPRTTFVIYSYNFGNFRNELAGLEPWLDALSVFGVDAFFFTDDRSFKPSTKLEGWTIVYEESKPDVNGIPGSRVTGKDIKFKGHPLLEPYVYHIHVDANHGYTIYVIMIKRERANQNLTLVNNIQCRYY